MRGALALAVVLLAGPLAAAPVDWNQEDWRLDRTLLVRAYIYQNTLPPDPWRQYRRATQLPSDVDSLGAAAFLALAPPEQDRRRREAREALELGIIAVRDPASRLYQASARGETPCLSAGCPPPAGAGEAVTRALTHLIRAVTLDPTGAEAWFHLGYFSALVGDQRRATAAREQFLRALAALPAAEAAALAPLRERAVLDEAWARREAGRYQECLDWLRANGPTPKVETTLIMGLVHAEQSHWIEAREAAGLLPVERIPVRSRVAWQVPASGMGPSEVTRSHDSGHGLQTESPQEITDEDVKITRLSFQRNSWEKRENDFLRRWVLTLTELRQGRDDEARRLLGQPDWDLEYPPGLAARWWQDQGLMHEELGDIDLAVRCYARAAIYRPYFLYYPVAQVRGMPNVYGVESCGMDYVLGYGTFYLGGSLFGYAANATLACDAEAPGPDRDLLFAAAGDQLDACVRRGVRPADALYLRGRLNFLAGDYTAAEADLMQAQQSLTAADPALANLQLLTGLTKLNLGDYAGCLPWLTRVVEVAPTTAIAWRALGLARAYQHQDAQALEAFDRALALEPDAASAVFNRGLLHYRAGDREQALADLRRAQELMPGNTQIAAVMKAMAAEGPLLKLELTPSPVTLELDAAQRERAAGVRQGSLAAVAAAAPDLGALVADQPKVVQDLLAPLWPDRITTGELQLLLQADRQLGDTARASALLRDLPAAADRWVDPAVWALGAAIFLDLDLPAMALPMLEAALRLDPDNLSLRSQRDRLQPR